ncbi:MAG: hypothetical protein PHH28_10345 [Desulfuromonadaceae bacterium]|nr:hypothetical protein [Desulfuromonadaceae bacterium]
MLQLKKTISIYYELDKENQGHLHFKKSKPYVEIHDILYHNGKQSLGAGRPLTESEAENIFSLFKEQSTNERLILPENVLMWRADSAMKGYECIFWLKSHVAPILFTGNMRFNVPWPSMVFHVRSHSIRVFALKNKRNRPKPGTALYHMPSWNTNDSGSVCTGNFDAKNCTTPEDAIATWEKFWFEADFSHPSGSIYADINLKEFWESLDGKEEFPTKMLVKSPYTLEGLLK